VRGETGVPPPYILQFNHCIAVIRHTSIHAYEVTGFHLFVWLQNEYLGLVEQCMVFACEMMDLCRGTQEVEAVLSEGGENGSPDPLARLKMAMEYEEKKVND